MKNIQQLINAFFFYFAKAGNDHSRIRPFHDRSKGTYTTKIDRPYLAPFVTDTFGKG